MVSVVKEPSNTFVYLNQITIATTYKMKLNCTIGIFWMDIDSKRMFRVASVFFFTQQRGGTNRNISIQDCFCILRFEKKKTKIFQLLDLLLALLEASFYCHSV